MFSLACKITVDIPLGVVLSAALTILRGQPLILAAVMGTSYQALGPRTGPSEPLT